MQNYQQVDRSWVRLACILNEWLDTIILLVHYPPAFHSIHKKSALLINIEFDSCGCDVHMFVKNWVRPRCKKLFNQQQHQQQLERIE